MMEIIGYLTVFIFAIAIFMFALDSLLYGIRYTFQRLTYKAARDARRSLGAQIFRDSYWFSEDENTMFALQEISKSIQEHPDGLYLVTNVRDTWRNKKNNV